MTDVNVTIIKLSAYSYNSVIFKADVYVCCVCVGLVSAMDSFSHLIDKMLLEE